MLRRQYPVARVERAFLGRYRGRLALDSREVAHTRKGLKDDNRMTAECSLRAYGRRSAADNEWRAADIRVMSTDNSPLATDIQLLSTDK